MSLPRPSYITDDIDAIVADLRDIDDSYKWLHGWAYSQPNVSDEPHVTTSNVSDPTFAAIDTQENVRHQLQLMLKYLRSAHGNVLAAWRAGSRAHEHKPRDGMAETLAGANIPKRELAALVAAQGRRNTRGEGYGEA